MPTRKYIVGKVSGTRVYFGLVEADNSAAAYALARELPARVLALSLEGKAYLWTGEQR